MTPLANVQDVATKSFDYIIVGAGTAGLTLAVRLTEDPGISVVVLEAGEPCLDDPFILTPATFAQHFGNKLYDWGHLTRKQKLVGEREFPWARGKCFGGSSAINFMVWSKPPAEEVNDFERLGNPGWNWANYQKYASKVERLIDPCPEQREKFNLRLHDGDVGREGSLAISYPKTISDLEKCFVETFENAGFSHAPRPYGGDPAGINITLNSHDPATGSRSYAVTGYYLPNKDRNNLVVLPKALVSRIVTEIGPDGNLTATGAEFISDEKSYIVHAKREVIVCAGALKSPQVLELSGIGKREVLEKAGVEVKVDLPAVGENLQEHIVGSFAFQLKDDVEWQTMDPLRDPRALAENKELFVKEKSGLLTMGIIGVSFYPVEAITPRASEIYEKAKAAVEKLDKNATSPGLLEQYRIQLERLEPGKNQTGPGCEILGMPGLFAGIPKPGKKYVTMGFGLNHMFSRGWAHIASNDPTAEPEIDPQYFDFDVDLDIVLELAKRARRIPLETPPLKDIVESDFIPGPSVKTDEELVQFIKDTYTTTWHTCGTCSMMPREKGGVVDHTLKVYGTSNIRVVDLSVVPLHFAAHSQATVYVIAEQAADITKGNFQA